MNVSKGNDKLKKYSLNPIYLSVILAFLICSCNPIYGFVESNFLLAQDSRLPVWIKLPEGYSRDDVTVSLFLYTFDKARFVVRGPAPERKTLINIVAKSDWHIATKKEVKRRGNYDFSPRYYSVVYQDTEDVISFPCKGPVFWMVDDVEKNYSVIEPECPSIDLELIGDPR